MQPRNSTCLHYILLFLPALILYPLGERERGGEGKIWVWKNTPISRLCGEKRAIEWQKGVLLKKKIFLLLSFWKEASEEKRAVISNEISFALKGLAGGGTKNEFSRFFFGREWGGKTRKRADKSFFIASSYFSISGMLPPSLSPFIAGIQLLLYQPTLLLFLTTTTQLFP